MSGFDPRPVLEGLTLRVRPLTVEDREALFRVARDPVIWATHPEPDRWRPEVFAVFFNRALADGALVVEDRADGRVIGSSRYHGWSGQSVEIGWTFLERALWGRGSNRELKALMLAHAFSWVDVVTFRVGAANWRSRHAVARLGAMLAGTAPQPGGSPGVVYRLTREGARPFLEAWAAMEAADLERQGEATEPPEPGDRRTTSVASSDRDGPS